MASYDQKSGIADVGIPPLWVMLKTQLNPLITK